MITYYKVKFTKIDFSEKCLKQLNREEIALIITDPFDVKTLRTFIRYP